MRNVIESSKEKEPAATPCRSRAPFQGARSLKTIHLFHLSSIRKDEDEKKIGEKGKTGSEAVAGLL